jgi:hypothetical protein
LALPRLTFAVFIIAAFFPSGSNGIATDIGSLAPGLEGHVLRLGIGFKGLQKIIKKHFFRCTPIPNVDSVAIAVLNITSRLPILATATDTFKITDQLALSSFYLS